MPGIGASSQCQWSVLEKLKEKVDERKISWHVYFFFIREKRTRISEFFKESLTRETKEDRRMLASSSLQNYSIKNINCLLIEEYY